MIEADVRRTRDNRLVMLHDATLDRTTSGSGPVTAIDFADLRALDAGSWFGSGYAGQLVPTLDELFDLADRLDVALCLEVKSDGDASASGLALAVAEEIRQRGRIERDALSSFDHGALAAARRAHPGLSLAPDRLPERGPSTAATLIAQARAIGATIIQHHHADLDATIVAGCHAADLAVWPWPTTAAIDIARSRRIGVDALMGDDVAAMVRELASSRP
jgi:glycerophosphoryl diester phosphodiesterase